MPAPRVRGGLALPLLLAVACGGGADRTAVADPAVTVPDAAGRTVALEEPARRVVSLVPSATLVLEALGARDRLVGRTDFDTATWAAELPSVGGGLEPNLEAVVSLRPDLVIRFAGEQDPATPARLDDLGIPHAAVRPDRIAGILESVRIVGQVVGRPAAADSLAHRLRAGLDSVGHAHEGRTSPRVAYVLGGTPPWVAGPGTYIHELIELAGAENVFAGLGSPYASVSPEEFVAREVDVILADQPGDVPPRLAGDVPVRQVSDALELPGPGVVRAAREVARLVHGTPPP